MCYFKYMHILPKFKLKFQYKNSFKMEYKKKQIKPDPVKEYRNFRILVVGEGGVGKTALCERIHSGNFDQKYNPTCGSDFYNAVIQIKGEDVKLNIFDMSGNPEFVEVRNEFYKETQALIVAFDITSKKSFDALDMWLREANKYGGEALPVWIVGCKVDMASKRAVEKAAAMEWTKSRSFKGYFEVSAMYGNDVNELFSDIVSKI